ncbi:MAG: hypothetical protein ACHQ7N_18655 [Candidatus Methylomirabilales bacterium]
MRKFLWVVGVGALVLAMAAPAMAMDFKFGGQTRVRFWDYTGLGFDNSMATNPGNNPRGADTRFRARFDVSDDNGNIQAVLRERVGWLVFGAGGGIQNPNNTAVPSNDLNTLTSGAGINSAGNNGSRTGSSSGGGLGGRGVNSETEWAYLDFQVPWNVPLRIRSGLLPWYLPKGMLIDDNVSGVQAYGTMAPVSYGVAWYRLNAMTRVGDPYLRDAPNGYGLASRDRSSATDDKYDVYEGKVNVAIAPWLNPGLYFDYGDNRVNCTGTDNTQAPGPLCGTNDRVRPNFFLGFTDTGKIGTVSYDLDFIYGYASGGIGGDFTRGTVNGTLSGSSAGFTSPGTPGDTAHPILVRGYAFDAGVHFPVGPVTLNLVGSYASGDSQKGGNNSGAFPGCYSCGWNGPGNAYEMIGNSSAVGFDTVNTSQSSMTNLWTIGTYATYNPVKALELKLAWAYAGFTSKNGNCAFAVANSVGCYGPVYYGSGFTPSATGIPITGAALGTGIGANNGNQGSGGLAGASGLGNEFHIMATWQVYTGFKILGVMAWLVPTHGDTEAKYAMMFSYDF